MVVLRRHLQAFYYCEDDDLCKIVSAIVTNQIIESTLSTTLSNGHSQRVRRRWDLSQCFGAIDGSHIPIITPTHSPKDYYNRKRFHSIVLQALVDHLYRFFNVCVG